MICAGLDAGSRATKVVLFDCDNKRILAQDLADQGVDQERLASDLLDRACSAAKINRSDLKGIIATGYGRNRIGFANSTITEITCHAKGVHHLCPQAQTIIEIGGQDSKVILLDNEGKVRDFSMNDRCAAGSGRFLEVVASRLEVDLPTLGKLSNASRNPSLISSMCVVFAETEIIGLLSEGVGAADIAAGVQNAIAQRVMALAGRNVQGPVCFTGGVALQSGMVRALETALKTKVIVASIPQYTGALGAALMAGQKASTGLVQ